MRPMKIVNAIVSILLKAVFALIGLLLPFGVIVFLVCSFFWPMSETIPERDLSKIVQAADGGDLMAMEVLVRKWKLDSVQYDYFEEQLLEAGNDFIYGRKMNEETWPEYAKIKDGITNKLSDEDKRANAIIQNRIDSIEEKWYERGVRHGSYEMASSAKSHYSAKYKRTKAQEDSLLMEHYAQEKENLIGKRFIYANYGEPLRRLAVGVFEKLGDWMTEPVEQLFSSQFLKGAVRLLAMLALGLICMIGPVKLCKRLGKSTIAGWPVKITAFYSILSAWIYAIGRINSGSCYCNLDAYNFFHSGASFGYLNDVCVWASWIWIVSAVLSALFVCYVLRKWWLLPVMIISCVVTFFGAIICTIYAYIAMLVVMIILIVLLTTSMSISTVGASVVRSVQLPTGWSFNPDGTIADGWGGIYREVMSGIWMRIR